MAERPRAVALALIPVPFVLQLVAQLAVAVAYRPTTDKSRFFYSPAIAVGILAAYVVLVVSTVLVARTAGPAREVLGLRRAPLARSIGLVLAGFVIAALAAQLLEPLFHGVRSQGLSPARFPGGARATFALAVTGTVTVVLGPFAEELYFRGLLLGRLRSYGTAIAIAVSSVIFGLVHFIPAAFPVLALLGVILGVIRVRTDSLWPGVAFHVLNNAAAILLAFS